VILLKVLSYSEIAICLAALCFLVVKGLWKQYWALGSFLAVRVLSSVFLNFIYLEVDRLGRRTAYHVYFYTYWTAFAVESVLAVFILFAVFRNIAGPLRGLRILGSYVVVAAAVILGALELNLAFAPGPPFAIRIMMAAVSQLQRAQSILTLCVLLFALLAMRPLGLSWRSRAFGVSLGLGLLAANDLVQSWQLAFHPALHTLSSLINGAVVCAMLAIWTAYLAFREPQRPDISLPPGSPWMRLNRMGLDLSAR
jgi:hypothetical protein